MLQFIVMEMNFCRRCGAKLRHTSNHIFKCDNKHTIFANATPAVGVFLLNGVGQVMLAVRGIEPHKGMLDAFGGFLDGEETIEAAIARELKEELNLDPFEYSEPRFLCTGISHYPYKGEVIPLLSNLFWTRLLTDRELTPSDDVADIYTVDIQDIDSTGSHDEDIGRGLQKLRSVLNVPL